MKYSITVLLWSALAVLIFTRTVAFPAKSHSLQLNAVSIERAVWLYSTNSRGFVRVHGGHVDSNGWKTDESAKLKLISVDLKVQGSSGVGVRIKSVTEDSYLCVNSAGDLTVEVNGSSLDRCIFKEDQNSGYRLFQSMYNSSWYLGFKRNGKVKQPHNTTVGQKAARFIPYFS